MLCCAHKCDAVLFFQDYEEVLLILNSKDSEGQTAVHVYVASNNLKLIGYITSRTDCLLSEQDHMHRTPLHLAAVLGKHPLIFSHFNF